MRVRAALRNGADVGDGLYAGSAKQRGEFDFTGGSMAKRVNFHWRAGRYISRLSYAQCSTA